MRRTRLEFTFLHFCQISNPIDYIHSNERKHDIDGWFQQNTYWANDTKTTTRKPHHDTYPFTPPYPMSRWPPMPIIGVSSSTFCCACASFFFSSTHDSNVESYKVNSVVWDKIVPCEFVRRWCLSWRASQSPLDWLASLIQWRHPVSRDRSNYN